MDPRHLQQLATILDKGSITAASKHLCLTQPTLTRNMRVLETTSRPWTAAPRASRRHEGRAAMQRLLIGPGLLLVAAGLLWPWLSKLPWGRLPGDISVERENFSFHFPLMTSLIVSVVLSLLLWWWRK